MLRLTFSEMFIDELKKSKLSMTAFSVKSGIPQSSVYRYITGEQTPLEKRRRKIAIALGKPEDYFLECEGEKPIIKKVYKEEQKTKPCDAGIKWGQVGGIGGSKIKGVK